MAPKIEGHVEVLGRLLPNNNVQGDKVRVLRMGVVMSVDLNRVSIWHNSLRDERAEKRLPASFRVSWQ